MGCDLTVIICDPEWSDAQTLRDVPNVAGVALFEAVKLLGRIISTVCQLDNKRKSHCLRYLLTTFGERSVC